MYQNVVEMAAKTIIICVCETESHELRIDLSIDYKERGHVERHLGL